MVGEATHPGGAQEVQGLDPGWNTQLLRIAQVLEAILADHGALSGLLDSDHDHGSSLIAASLLDDDHTQYALLAGRGTGQTLNGGLNAGNDLTLLGTAHATPGSVIIQSSIIFEMDGATGQLKLPTTGSSAGLLIGGDVQLYRTAANVWSSPDSLRLGGYIGAGTESAPSNTTAGDVTGLRGHFGTDGTFTADAGLELVGKNAVVSAGSLTLSGTVSSQDKLSVTGTITGSNPLPLNFQVTLAPTAAGSHSGWGAFISAVAAPVAGQTFANYFGIQLFISTGSGAGAVTNAYGLYISPNYGTVKPTSSYGVFIDNVGSASITTSVGLVVTLPTGSTNNYYISFPTGDATDPTGGGGAATGRIRCLIGGTLRYLPYY